MLILIPTLLLVLLPQAGVVTPSRNTAHLYESCKAFARVTDGQDGHVDAYTAPYCLGYMQGYFAGVALLSAPGVACASHATKGTVARVYAAYMDRNPRLFDEPEEVGFFLSMHDSYGCPVGR
jgi:Rap1a immunity proteins